MGREPGRVHKETTLDSALKDKLKLDTRRRKGHDMRKGRDRGHGGCTKTEDRGAKGLERNAKHNSEVSRLKMWGVTGKGCLEGASGLCDGEKCAIRLENCRPLFTDLVGINKGQDTAVLFPRWYPKV